MFSHEMKLWCSNPEIKPKYFLFYLIFCWLAWQIKLQPVRAQQKLRKCNYLQTGEQLANRIEQNEFKGKVRDRDLGSGAGIGIQVWNPGSGSRIRI